MAANHSYHLNGRRTNSVDSGAWVRTTRVLLNNFQSADKILSSYGTPFLLGLGISEQLTSLVWLAGPISGLIAQPVIGI